MMVTREDSIKPTVDVMNLMKEKPYDYNKIMCEAARSGHMDIVKQMLEKGAQKLILFENSPEKCILNSRIRNDKRDGQKMEQCILNYSKEYLLENYKNYDHEILSISRHPYDEI